MKKIISSILVLSLCIIPIKSSVSPAVKTEALSLPHKLSYSDFNLLEKSKINKLSSIANDSPTLKAEYINDIKDDELFEYCLKETLNTYYGEPEKYENELETFKKDISSSAEEIIENYEEAAEERATAKENGYSPTEVLVSFEPGTSEETIKTVAESVGSGCEIVFDGHYHPVEDIPEHRKNI